MLTYEAVSIAFSLAASIIIFGGITGGHFNPAVTLGVYIQEAKWAENLKWLGIIWLAQFCGGLLAWFLTECTLFTGKFGTIPFSDVTKLCPQDPTNADPTQSICDGTHEGAGFLLDWQVIFNEVILTFVFVSVILQFKGGEKTAPSGDGIMAVLCICLTLLACIRTGGKLGGCFNP